jgi:hypothetical protein
MTRSAWTLDGDGLLRVALRLDAGASGALGALLLALGPALADPLGLPTPLLRPTGLFLVVYAAGLWLAASRPIVSRTAAWAIVALNALWVLDSVATVASGWLALTALGTALVLAQAAAVALLADLQVLGLRRAAR